MSALLLSAISGAYQILSILTLGGGRVHAQVCASVLLQLTGQKLD